MTVSSPNYGVASASTQADEFQPRGYEDTYNNYQGNSFVKQAGTKHIIRSGETIAGLADLYGYTEKRFRAINLLKPGEELSVGSSILSTDCTCDRVISYDDLNNRAYDNSGNYGRTSNNTSNNNRGTIRSNDTYQPRGGSDRDDFYDNAQGSYGGTSTNNPPPAQPINSANTNRPKAYGNNSGNTAGVPSTVSAAYMSAQEIAMLDEINLVRSNPAGYIPYVEQYKRDIQSGKSFGSSLAVCDELIAELRRTPRLSILKPAPCLYNAAKNHGLDQKSRGSTGHDGSDGSWPWERVKRACSQMTDGNENLVGGPADVREAVILLLVDDGIPSRGHRKTLLNKDWVYGATYKIGKVGFMPNCWVQKFGF